MFKEIFHGRSEFMLKETREKKYGREMGALASNLELIILNLVP
jgi:hypothetical protein